MLSKDLPKMVQVLIPEDLYISFVLMPIPCCGSLGLVINKTDTYRKNLIRLFVLLQLETRNNILSRLLGHFFGEFRIKIAFISLKFKGILKCIMWALRYFKNNLSKSKISHPLKKCCREPYIRDLLPKSWPLGFILTFVQFWSGVFLFVYSFSFYLIEFLPQAWTLLIVHYRKWQLFYQCIRIEINNLCLLDVSKSR